jgi:hypothetical protein
MLFAVTLCMRTRYPAWFGALAVGGALSGCAEVAGDVGAFEDEATTDNGLSTVNGLSVVNGLSTVNGLSIVNGLSTVNGVPSGSGMMTTATGRAQVAYIVRCALPASASITKTDQYGTSYTFQGLLGLAPQWQSGACDTTCQESVSACLLAHVNTAGIHIPLWIVSQHAAVGWGQDPEFPNQEAAFFGNVFMPGAHGTDPNKPPMYYCTGAKYNVSPPEGRVGGTQTNPPYINPFGSTYASCSGQTRCSAADYPRQTDGFKACNGWNNVVTVWRQKTAGATTSPTGGTGRGYRWK